MKEDLLFLLSDCCDIKNAYNIIAEELYVTGYPGLPKYDENDTKENLIVLLVNITWTLIKHRQKYVHNGLEREQNKIILELQIKNLEKKVADLEVSCKTVKSDASKKLNELEVMRRRKDEAYQELSSCRKECQKLQKLLLSRNEEYCNDIRQKEYEIIELQKIIAQKIDVKRSFRNVYNSIDKSSGGCPGNEESISTHMKDIENLYKESISKLERTVRTLVEENINIRNAMELFTRKLYELYQIGQTKFNSESTNNGTSQEFDKDTRTFYSDDALPQHFLYLPSESILKHVESHVCDIIDRTINLFYYKT